MIDSHVHFWDYHPVKDAWITDEMKVLQQNFTPQQLEVELKANGVTGCVAVQADQSEKETIFLSEYANNHPFIMGVVGWIDLRCKQLPDRLDHFSQHTKIKGWRHIVQAEAEGFLSTADFINGIAELQPYSYTYDILINKQQLREAIALVEKFPSQRFVLDHIAKPSIAMRKTDETWAREIGLLAQHENVYCKVSGMVTEANWQKWTYDDMIYYLNVVFEHFKPNRIMFGSDWPVCTLAASYQQTKQIVETFTAQLNKQEKEAVFHTTAQQCYQL